MSNLPTMSSSTMTSDDHDRDRVHRQEDHRTNPTVVAYGEFLLAYQHFNQSLFLPTFGVLLPDCIITMQRRSNRSKGYFSADRFGNNELQGVTTDEIAMNPRFLKQDAKLTMSTLVHEMAHLYIYRFVETNRTAYHSRAWANAMLALGLHPTDDGTFTGRQTGQRVTHIIVPGGPFDVSADALITRDFRISWHERLSRSSQYGPSGGAQTAQPGHSRSDRGSGKRVKFTCRQCAANAWGRPSLHLICGGCLASMVAS